MDVGKLKERIADDLNDGVWGNVIEQVVSQVVDTLADLQPQDVFEVSELEEWAEENGFTKDDE